MVATKREDGLYDVPGLNFGVPLEYVPEQHKPPPEDLYNQNAAGPPTGPDARLADNRGLQNNTGQPIDIDAYERQRNEEKAKADAQSNFFEHPPTGEQLSAYQQPKPTAQNSAGVALEPGPGESGGRGVAPERTPMDNAFAQQILRVGRGGYAPGGDRMVVQQWQNQDESVNPSEKNAPHVLTDPETGEPFMTPEKEGELYPTTKKGLEKVDRSVAGAMQAGYEPGTVPSTTGARHYLKPNEQQQITGMGTVPSVPSHPIVGTGAQEFDLRQERQKTMEAQAADQAQGAMRRDARRDLNSGRMLQGAADDEKADLDKARAEYDQQKADLDNVRVQVQQIAKTLPQLAQQYSVPPDTKSHFGLAIAQGLMVLGGRPFVNLVREAIQDDFQREQAMQHWALQGAQVQLGALSTLAHLTSQTRDPVAAAHAFAALRWQQAQHQLEAFNVQAMGGKKSDEAQQMYEQMEVAKQHELKQMIGSTHARQWATVPGQSTPGGFEAVSRYIDQSFKDKKIANDVKKQVFGQMQRGEPITMPKFDANGNISRTDEKIGEQAMGTAVRLPEWLDKRQPVVHTHHPGEGDKARKVFDAEETGNMLLTSAEGILHHAAARWNPTYAAELDEVMSQLLSVAKNNDQDGTLKMAELPLLEKRIGAHAIRNITSPADAQAIIDFTRKIMRKSAVSQAGTSQMTYTPGGSDYWLKGHTPEGKNFFRTYGGAVEGVPEE